jgi:hypothetical protein
LVAGGLWGSITVVLRAHSSPVVMEDSDLHMLRELRPASRHVPNGSLAPALNIILHIGLLGSRYDPIISPDGRPPRCNPLV